MGWAGTGNAGIPIVLFVELFYSFDGFDGLQRDVVAPLFKRFCF